MLLEVFNHVTFIILSIVFLWKGADWTVDNAVILARKFHISEVVIGVTIVAFGTSLPEIAATASSALKGHGDIALSNVIGSNIFNLGIVLGTCTLTTPLYIQSESLYRDGCTLMFISLLILIFAVDMYLDRIAGGILLFMLMLYILILLRKFGKLVPITTNIPSVEFKLKNAVLLFVGLAMVVLGGHLIVSGVVDLGRMFGIQEWILGLSIVAFGTSLPEIAISFASLLKQKQDIMIGNLIGSDIFNFLGALGISCLLSPISLTANALISQVMLLIFLISLMIFMRTDWRLNKTEGALILTMALIREFYFII